MADANDVVPDGTKPAPDGAPATPKSYSEEEFKKVVAERQEAKAKLKEFETRIAEIEAEKKKAAEKDLTKDQLIAEREKELERIKAERESLAQEAKKFREQQQALKNQMLAKITDADLKKLGEKLEIDELTVFVEKLTSSKFTGASKGSLDTNKQPDFKNFAEWEKYAKENGLIS